MTIDDTQANITQPDIPTEGTEDLQEENQRLTYRGKEVFQCPVCGTTVHKEGILSGGGRLVAGELSDELRRFYEPTQKFGEVYPLIYQVLVCPKCYFASFPSDFTPSCVRREEAVELQVQEQQRKNLLAPLFTELDFERSRTLSEGAASYILALLCYEKLDGELCPTFKQGMCALRCAWLLESLHAREPGENYDYLAQLLHKKATFYYRKAVELDANGKEACSKISYSGPDTDNNYGFDGIEYLAGLLEFKYGFKTDPVKRYAALKESASILSRIVGFDKANKEKPRPILELARDVFQQIKNEQKQLEDSGVLSSE